MAVPSAALQPDPVFFPMAEFQVEGFLFRVPLYIFQQSQFFRENVLTQPTSDADPPYELQDTTAAEFRDLLRSILPMAGPFPSGATALTNVLKLATRWKFESARRVAIRKITCTIDDPALTLVLARTYAVPEFLPVALRGLVDAPALEAADYAVLARAAAPASPLGALGLGLVAKVVKYRERARCKQRESVAAAAAVERDPDPDLPADRRRRLALVEEIFGAEFARDYRKGEETIAARAMALTQPRQAPPAHRSRPCL